MTATAMAATAGLGKTWEGADLDTEEVERYARQLVLPKFGARNQTKLRDSSVLVVGAGGLGSPVCLYLAAAGVGTLGVVDQDEVDRSNLHRQILHTEDQVGEHKAVSAAISIKRLNSTTTVETHVDGFRPGTALGLVGRYDAVVDASDNPATRYCVNDACVIAGKPLISGAAIGTDGQMSVYNHGEDCPCYRCVWPVPPEAGSCQRCSDAGVLGVLPGIIGTLQALETIKVLTGVGECATQRLVLFDGMSTCFRSLKLRPRQSDCAVCGDHPAITADNIGAFDYESECGGPMHDRGGGACLRVLSESNRVDARSLSKKLADLSEASEEARAAVGLVDVRPKAEFDFASLPGFVNLPFDELEDFGRSWGDGAGGETLLRGKREVYVVCRRGNDSQLAVEKILGSGLVEASAGVFDLEGGLQEWSRTVDDTFPVY